jgi:integration host factor subunit beta
MTRSELINALNEKVSEYSSKEVEVIVDTIFDSMTEALSRGEKVELRGFGSFKVRERSPRVGRNPKTGNRVEVGPKRALLFKTARELWQRLNS